MPDRVRGQLVHREHHIRRLRSSKEAQATFITALASAVRVYGRGEEASRAAYVEFKRTFEKCGDHWIPKQAS